MLNLELLRAQTPGVACCEELVRIGRAARCGDGVYVASAAAGLARLQCLKVTRIGSSGTGTYKDLHVNTLQEYFLNLHMHASGE
jgi:hypothetical protein